MLRHNYYKVPDIFFLFCTNNKQGIDCRQTHKYIGEKGRKVKSITE